MSRRPRRSPLFPYTTLFRSRSDFSSASRARIQFRLPLTVLISPLCAMNRYGWASSQAGNVLVENREWTSAIALLYRRSDRRSEEHTSELQSQSNLVCRLLLE